MANINCLDGLTSYPLGCREAAGTQIVYLSPYSGSSVWTYDADGMVTGATNPGTFYSFPQRLETAEFIPGEGQYSNENGTAFYNENLNIVLHKYQQSLRNLVYTLGKAEVVALVKTQTGKIFLVGEENGMLVTASNSSVGKALGDLNGTTISLQSKSIAPSREVSSTFFSTLTIL